MSAQQVNLLNRSPITMEILRLGFAGLVAAVSATWRVGTVLAEVQRQQSTQAQIQQAQADEIARLKVIVVPRQEHEQVWNASKQTLEDFRQEQRDQRRLLNEILSRLPAK